MCTSARWHARTRAQVAAGIATGDELVLCEMIFGGAFNALSVEQLAAACSCFVWREKSEASPKVGAGARSRGLVPCASHLSFCPHARPLPSQHDVLRMPHPHCTSFQGS